MHDSAAEARLAGDELLRLDRASYAFLGLERGYFWDRERQDEFRRLCAAAGKPMAVLRRKSLKASLAALPKPCGILAANDRCAVEVWPATAMGCSRRRATALFRQVTGRSILDEIRERRLDEAMRLLRNPNQQIDAIADLCGYSAPSFLKRLFKARTGLSMRAWRQTNAAQASPPRTSGT